MTDSLSPSDGSATRRGLAGVTVPIACAVLVVGAAGATAAVVRERGGSAAGRHGVSAAVSTTGSLSVSSASVVQGATLTFTYSTPSATVNSENWVGLYSNPGNGPVGQSYVGPSTQWAWATAASGTVSFSTSSLSPGSYIAYYLYDDGYTWLAQPVVFTVTAAPAATPPAYLAAFGSGTLSSPSGIALDAKGDVWVSDTGDNRVVEFSATGTVLATFDPTGTYALNGPTALTLNSAGDVFVADTGNNRVVELSPSGAGLETFGTASGSGELSGPRGVAVNSSGTVLIADTGDERVAEFSSTGTYKSAFSTDMGSPEGIAIDSSGDVWVANAGVDDAGPDRVLEYNSSGTYEASLGTGEASTLGGLSNPSDVALDGSGHAYVADPDYGWAEEFSTSGTYLDEFGTASPGLLSAPQALAVNGSGDVYVTDTGNGRIVEFGPAS
jgi:sugar lactone lactonase YvrE